MATWSNSIRFPVGSSRGYGIPVDLYCPVYRAQEFGHSPPVVPVVPNNEFRSMGLAAMMELMGDSQVLVDVKGVFRDEVDNEKICYKKL